MKIIRILLICMVMMSIGAFHLQALNKRHLTPEQQQSRKERLQKIQNAKIAYITEKLTLDSEQAQKFWPVYNQYEKEKEALRKKSRVFRGEKLEALSDQEIEEALKNRIEVKQSEVALEKQYMDNFLKVISTRQLAILYRSEREFTQVLLKKLDIKHHQPAQ